MNEGVEPRQVFSAMAYEPMHTPPGAHCHVCGQLGVVADGSRLECHDCGEVRYRNAAPTVAILVVDNDNLVICRRRPDAFEGGKWCLPSGYVDYDEDYLTAAHREVREETGLIVQLEGLLSVVSNFLSPTVQSVCVVLLARKVGGDLAAGDDVDIAKWHRWPDTLPEMAFDADQHIIERYFARPFTGAPLDPRHSLSDDAGPEG